MTGRRILSSPHECATAEEDKTDVQLLTRRQRYLSRLLIQFWNRWKSEYVVDLREHHRPANEGACVAQSVAPGDIVTVMEEGKSNRSTWKLGKTEEVHPGNDGFVRGATVEVASSNGKRKRPRRPLFPQEDREVGGMEQVPEVNTLQRQRSAVILGEVRRREVDQFLQEQEDSF